DYGLWLPRRFACSRIPAKSHLAYPSRRRAMFYRSWALAFAMASALILMWNDAAAADDSKYPDWKGQWSRFNTNSEGQAVKFDPAKPSGPGQQAPLTPEYQKVLEDSMADQARGGLGNYPTARCLPGGMPRMMAAPVQEYVVTPGNTYILVGVELRRIFTDGRDFPPPSVEPTYQGYAIGK